MSDKELGDALALSAVAVFVIVVLSLGVGVMISRAVFNVLFAAYCCVTGVIVVGFVFAIFYFVTWPAVRQITAEIKNDYKEAKRENDEQ